MVDPFFANIDISPVNGVPSTRHQELEDFVKELEPVEADMELIDHMFYTPLYNLLQTPQHFMLDIH